MAPHFDTWPTFIGLRNWSSRACPVCACEIYETEPPFSFFSTLFSNFFRCYFFFYFPPTLLSFSAIVTLIFQLIPSFPFVFLVASFREIQTFPFLRSSYFALFFDCFQERFCLRATCIEIFVADRFYRLWNETCPRLYIFWNCFNRILVI